MVAPSKAMPPGLYDVDYFKLPNGLDAVLKKRPHAHSVSVRLVVNVGLRNFPCDNWETPHLLEHLLFMGTSRHSETDLNYLRFSQDWQDRGRGQKLHVFPRSR